MSGHSKWSQIKRSKAKIDAQKGALFSKISKEIVVAVRMGGGPDVGSNFRLRTVIEKAKVASMPVDNIKRAIQRASGDSSTDNYEEIQYEGYGPCGTAIIVSTMTDNRNRTAGDIRSYFTKCDGNLGETGCVSWMFVTKGLITVTSLNGKAIDFDELFLSAADSGAEDVIELDEGAYQVQTKPENLEKVEKALKEMGYATQDVEVSQEPENTVQIEDFDKAKKVIKLIDLLESHDDVQDVYSNFELSDEVLSLVS